MRNRSEIKWEPFDSLFHSKDVLNDLEKKKQYQKKPTLSTDELEVLDFQLQEAYHTQAAVKISYYYQGYIYTKIGVISKINKQNFQICFDNSTSLYFEQILSIYFL